MELRLISKLLVLVAVFVACAGYSAFAGDESRDEAKNVKLVGRLDIEGGGMVHVANGLAYIGHMAPPYATSIVDVSDPTNPKILSKIKTLPGTHSHKVRVCGPTMIINREQYAESTLGQAFSTLFNVAIDNIGLAVFDVSDSKNPKQVSFLKAGGFELYNIRAGVHRFEFDCQRKLAYISTTRDGYRGNIVEIVDLSDPSNPSVIGRWWHKGQWIAGGEKPKEKWKHKGVSVHHPLRLGDRLYVSLWFGGFSIVDISDITKPTTISHVAHVRPSPTHTALPVDHKIMGRKWLVIFDEDIKGECEDPPASMWVYDITDEIKPVQTSVYRPAPDNNYGFCDGQQEEKRFGAHQPHEYVAKDNLVYGAWYSSGLRIVDISNPYQPKEVGYYVPAPKAGAEYNFPASNDVFVDDNGLIYLLDRFNGLTILKYQAYKNVVDSDAG